MNRTRSILLLALALLATPAFGQADFTRYVAFGDSLTAGYQSSSLFETGQRSSYPVLIYNQTHGTTQGFELPIVTDPGFPTPRRGYGLPDPAPGLRIPSLTPRRAL